MQILESWFEDIIQQFKGKKNIEILIYAFAKQMQEIAQVFYDVNNLTELEVATGQNLDYVGTIIPLTRKEATVMLGGNVTLDDDMYRRYLKYMRLRNTNDCTYYDLMDGIKLLWGVEPVYYIEDETLPATIILEMPVNREFISIGDIPMIKPAGVRILFDYKIMSLMDVYVGGCVVQSIRVELNPL